jgi:hypothetical protein
MGRPLFKKKKKGEMPPVHYTELAARWALSQQHGPRQPDGGDANILAKYLVYALEGCCSAAVDVRIVIFALCFYSLDTL